MVGRSLIWAIEGIYTGDANKFLVTMRASEPCMIRFLFAWVSLVGALNVEHAASAQTLDERFQSFEWHSVESLNNRVYWYRLYVPPEVPSGKGWPLLVWFHGSGERGEDNHASLRWLQLLFDSAHDHPPLLILVTQHHTDEDWSVSGEGSDSDALSVTYEIMTRLMTQYLVDPKRIYLAGVSSGGNACFEMAIRHPTEFAAAAPMSAVGGPIAQAARLKTLPIWVFRSRADIATSTENVRQMVRAVQEAGGIAALTETEPVTYSHDSWTVAFKDFHVLEWLLAQRSDAPKTWLPGQSFISIVVFWVKSSGLLFLFWLGVFSLLLITWLYRRAKCHAALHQITDPRIENVTDDGT
jgi:poly(3-hydroxybutyrate) depolymerase